ncbi:MAG: peptidylprolyl isomerase [Candidatus Omnitrophica bacterium]|nr:peptidylprolyl isomerase [Candidatus Omnitrophota bacterium]
MRNIFKAGLVGLGIVIMVIAGRAGLVQAEEKRVAAVVNGQNIYLHEVEDLMPPSVPLAQREEFKKQVVERLVSEKLLSGFMAKQKVKIDKKDFERKVAQIRNGLKLQLQLEKYLNNEITDQKLKQAFEKETKNSLKASHILIKINEETSEELAKEKIANIAQELKTGVDFAKLAKKYSDCPSSQDGGNLGVFGPGRMVAEFSEAASKLEPGQVSEPVQTQFGWHLIKRTEIVFEDMKESLSARLKTQLFDELLDKLKEDADINMKT